MNNLFFTALCLVLLYYCFFYLPQKNNANRPLPQNQETQTEIEEDKELETKIDELIQNIKQFNSSLK